MPLPQALLLQLTYVPGDCAKAVIATVVTLALRRRFPQLGWRNGALAIIVWLFMAAIGLPVLVGGAGGFPHFFGATAGYIWSYPVAAALIGLSVQALDRLKKTKLDNQSP
ncbi:hypothetical protein GQS40_10315|uniref:Uncharacterized protein n=1 Tax=Leuconostoc lactis TaxID=1246 RepID=A0A6L7ADH5_LEULA|nr:hypothetical protein [Leuconostoc lactis]